MYICNLTYIRIPNMEYAIVISSIGFVSHSLFEYLGHRFLGHGALLRKYHQGHHLHPDYIIPITEAHPWRCASLIFLTLLLSIPYMTVGFYLFGLSLGYIFSEYFHYILHKYPEFILSRWMRNNHLRHHINPSVNFGFTTTVWDRIFGTYVSPESIAWTYKDLQE